MTRRTNRLDGEIERVTKQLDDLRVSIRIQREELAKDLQGVREAALGEKAAVERRHGELKTELDIEEEELRKRISAERDEVAAERIELRADQRAFKQVVEGQLPAFSQQLAELWHEYEVTRGMRIADELISKPHPARTAARQVQAKARELADARREMALSRGLVVLYEGNFPWLAELRDADLPFPLRKGVEPTGDPEPDADAEANEDPARNWLAPDEFRALPSAERNQLALERYLKSRKSPWEIGRDFELYIGHLRERAGCHVIYQGIVEGFDDLGRDLLCSRGDALEIVQCKRWAAHKKIHEKHIFQLFGTMVSARIEHREMDVTGTFVTTTNLSERARRFAAELGIKVEEGFPVGEFPRIKCNIARHTGEKIYHLPFDQQYDSTVIEPRHGERWATTAREAEDAGFRRAFRWRGESGKI